MTEMFEGVDFADVQVGDRIHFLTKDNGFGGTGDMIVRTGAVTAKTEKTVTVDCEGNRFGKVARLRRADWSAREPRIAVDPEATQALIAAEANGAEIRCAQQSDRSNVGRRVIHRPRYAGDPKPWVPMFDQFRPDARRYGSHECTAGQAAEKGREVKQQYGIYDGDDLIEDGFRGDYGRIAAGATAADYAADPTNDGRTFEVKPIEEDES